MNRTLSTLVFLLLFFFAQRTFAQKSEGIATFEYAYNWTQIYSRLTFLSQEEKDRIKLTWGNDESSKTKMKLLFSPSRSVYTYVSAQGETDDGRYSWRNDDYLIERNFDQETKTELIEMLGKTYLVSDSLRTPAWKISNQVKDIAGYICTRAVTEDPVKKHKIVAWFAQDIAVPAGPEQYFGLPGLILELDVNDGDVVATATKVEFKDVQKELVLPKMKGKKITTKEYNALITNHINDSMKAHRNPYWAMRY